MSALPPPLSETDAIIRHRVLARDTELLTVVKRYHAYITALQRYHTANFPPSASPSSSSPPPSLADVADAHQRLLHEVDVLSFTLSRHSSIHSSLDSELLASNATSAAIRSHTASLQAQLLALRSELEQAQRERQQREEYEGVARQLEVMDSRAELQATVRGLEGDLEGLEEEERRLTEEEDRKRKRFSLLLLSLHALRAEWEKGEATAVEDGSSAARPARSRRGSNRQRSDSAASTAAAPTDDEAMAVG